MTRRNPLLTFILSIIAGAGLFALLVWGNFQFTSENKGGEDLLLHWDNARAFVRNGLSPYSDEAAERVEILVYGHTAQVDSDRMIAAYPLYTIVLYLPLSAIEDPALARAVWMAILEVALIIAAILSVILTGWRPKPLILLLFLFFMIFWYHGIRPIVAGDLAPLVTLAVVGALLAIKGEHDELAGVLLGLATMKPEMVLVLLVYILVWGASNRRMKVFIYAIGTFALLCGFAVLLIPDWMIQYLRTFFIPTGPLTVSTISEALGVFLQTGGARVGTAISIIVAVGLVIEWTVTRNTGFRGFLWTACFTIVASFWLGIKTSPDNFILALPALAVVFAGWTQRWRRYGSAVVVATMILLYGIFWILFSGTFTMILESFQRPILFFPLPFLMFILLYWVRWWTIHPPQVWFDNFK